MKRFVLLAALLMGGAALADITLKQANTTVGNVKAVNCSPDGGLLCSRSTGSVGNLRCNAANTTEPGCVTPSDQTFAGDKTFTGNIKATGVDAGWVQGGSVHVEGSTVTGTDTGTPLTITSSASDSTTSSTTPAMKFKLGASVTGTDLGWEWVNASGTKELGLSAQGDLTLVRYFVTDDGAPTANGTFMGLFPGNGGAASGATPAGAGAMFQVIAGSGGAASASATGGTGGAVAISAGSGGATATSESGGAGGDLGLHAGTGIYGGTAGAATLYGGNGGYESALGPTAAAGGSASVIGGLGGNAVSGTAGAGGAVLLIGGAGGDGVSGTAGAGGAVTITSGNGGAVGSSGGASGDVTIDTGTPSGAADPGNVNIGTANARTITIGRASGGWPVILPGTGASGGQPTQIAQILLTGDVGTSFSKHSNLGATSIDFPNIVAHTCSDQTKSLANAVADDTVFCSFPAALNTALAPSCFVSAPGVITFRLCNVTGSDYDPPAGNFAARRFQ